ncbi:hypothetical protein N0V93_005443 [Gnomoniopsis smithogilvyi]|uniref:CPAF-like PDZ domain-containing protein n=1 Tax=Gnomoniopsis smithogilvyi TaxID=1191159 RepID=A0A9W8YUR0_9PEZI|nr:hypothetical protein N0V93_005443 [Gnomoniopsis smithogilvyi]
MMLRYAPVLLTTTWWIATAESRHADTRVLQARNETEPCAQVSSAWAAQKAANASATVVVDGQLAYDCLNSVPLHEDDAVKLVRSIQPFLDWQTTSSYLKDPPEGYQFPAFDVEAAFDDIISNVQSGQYQNEYEFQNDLYLTFSKAKDGHFRFFPDLLTAAIVFRRDNLALASVSLDGKSVPKIYTLSDIRLYNSDPSFVPSPIASLNGKDPVATNEELSLLGVLQDRDALYNTMFYSPAFFASNKGDWQGYYGGSGRFGYVWPGPNTAVEFENGTTVNYQTTARVVGDFSGISDGPSFYAKYCSGSQPVTAVASPTVTTPLPTSTSTAAPTGNLTAPPPLGYPEPVVITSDQSAAGYFLPNTDAPAIPVEFQRAVQILFEDAKAAGKTKLIVDVSANGGGYIFQGHDTFRQLFPQIQQDGFNRFRSTELGQIAGRQFSAAIPNGFDPETSGNDTLIGIYESYQNYRYDLDVANKSFTSVEDKFSTDTFNNDNFTQIHRWNFDDPLTTSNITYGIGYDVTGYRSRQNFTQPFAAENIILLYDGYCASTCTLFSEFLRVQAGVRSVTFGGRPELAGDGDVPIIQNYGGVKGSNNVGYSYFNTLAAISLGAQGLTPNEASGPVALSEAEIEFLNLNLDTYALNRSTGTSLNVRDNILRDHLEDGVPAQFIYEPTDCRLFYTPLSIVDPVEQWRLAAEAAWGDGSCVAGTLQSTSGSRLKRGVTSAAGVKMGKVVSMPDKAPLVTTDWVEGVPY